MLFNISSILFRDTLTLLKLTPKSLKDSKIKIRRCVICNNLSEDGYTTLFNQIKDTNFRDPVDVILWLEC